jgi:hypothetical protein
MPISRESGAGREDHNAPGSRVDAQSRRAGTCYENACRPERRTDLFTILKIREGQSHVGPYVFFRRGDFVDVPHRERSREGGTLGARATYCLLTLFRDHTQQYATPLPALAIPKSPMIPRPGHSSPTVMLTWVRINPNVFNRLGCHRGRKEVIPSWHGFFPVLAPFEGPKTSRGYHMTWGYPHLMGWGAITSCDRSLPSDTLPTSPRNVRAAPKPYPPAV